MADIGKLRFGPDHHTEEPNQPVGPSLADVVRHTKRRVTQPAAEKHKPSYIGAPAYFALELACRDLWDAFDGLGLYVVGSALERPDWRDIDLRMILEDDAFDALFPYAGRKVFQHDGRWLLLTTAISQYLAKATGLPIDFQFQPQSYANERYAGKRNAIGMRIRREGADG